MLLRENNVMFGNKARVKAKEQNILPLRSSEY